MYKKGTQVRRLEQLSSINHTNNKIDTYISEPPYSFIHIRHLLSKKVVKQICKTMYVKKIEKLEEIL